MLLKAEDLVNLKLQTRDEKHAGNRPTRGKECLCAGTMVVLGLQPPRICVERSNDTLILSLSSPPLVCEYLWEL